MSTVRSNEKGKLSFLEELRRLNVTITRAMKKLIIIWDIETLSHNDTYKRLIEDCRSENSVIEFKCEMEELEYNRGIDVKLLCNSLIWWLFLNIKTKGGYVLMLKFNNVASQILT